MLRRSYTPRLDIDTAGTFATTPFPAPLLVASGSVAGGAPPPAVRRESSYLMRPRTHNGAHQPTRLRIPVALGRLLHPQALDFDQAMWDIVYLMVLPRRVYKQVYYQKQTKGRWLRDDPSFMVLLTLFLVVLAVAWGIAYSPLVGGVLKLVVYMVGVDFFGIGAVVATVGWVVANKFLKRSTSGAIIGGVTEDDLEWAYCFDVHCNLFLVVWVLLYLVQFVLLPVLRWNAWILLFLGNTLYFVAGCYYMVVTFHGYNALPFLDHSQLILLPVPLMAMLYVVSLFGFNIAKHMTNAYFN